MSKLTLLTLLALTTHVLWAMATSNTTVTTTPNGMWTVNKLYDSLPHTPNPVQNDGPPQTSKTVVTEKEDSDKTPVGSRPQSASRRITDIGGGNRRLHYNTPRPREMSLLHRTTSVLGAPSIERPELASPCP